MWRVYLALVVAALLWGSLYPAAKPAVAAVGAAVLVSLTLLGGVQWISDLLRGFVDGDLLHQVAVVAMVALLLSAIALFLVGAQAQGLLISTIADTQQVAFQIALLSSLLPTMMLSGFIFPISSMPIVVQWITHIVPARYFLVALRAVVLKGADVTAFWQDMLALVIFATVAMGLASLRLRRQWA